MTKQRAAFLQTLAKVSGVTLLVLLPLPLAQGQLPTWAPTSSMWPTSTPIPTGSAYPTSTWTPTSTPLPTITPFPSRSPPVVPTKVPTKAPTRRPTRAPILPATAMPTPTPAIAEIETAPPTNRPTPRPTRRPTAAPVAVVPVPIPTTAPNPAPTARPTDAPVAAPTASPVAAETDNPTLAPVVAPTAAPVVTATDPPTAVPTTLSPTTTPTTAPTLTPTEAPTETAESITTVVDGIQLTLVNAGQLTTEQLTEWEGVTNAWFNGYYANNAAQSNVRNMLGVVSVVTQQELVDADSDLPVNFITYSHRLNYDALPSAPEAQVLAVVPYGAEAANAEYARLLQQRFPSVFGELQTPIAIPEFTSPTTMPTAAPVTEVPSDAPSLAPVTAAPTVVNMTTESPGSAAPTTMNMTAVPSDAPTAAPAVGTPVDTALRSITLQFVNAATLNDAEVETFQTIMSDWFENYFLQENGGNSGGGSRRLQADRDTVRDMSSEIVVKEQVVETTNGVQTNTVTYDQLLSYIALEGAAEPEDYATLPFEDQNSNAALGLELRQIESFKDVRLPLQVPDVPDQSSIRDGGGDDGLGTGAIAGIAAGGAVVLLGLGFFGYNQMRAGGEYKDSEQLPPSHFNVSADEDISTMDEPVTRVGDQPSLSGGYGDQSVATVDYDYSKAYGGGDTSVVSSAGGTMGDATRQTGDVTAGGTALTALGAEANYGESLGAKEEVIEIYAPAGKLGVVIDTPDDGAPVVHAVKDSSVIADQIQVGDKLIAVDNDDVRSMTAIKVSKLISKKSANPSRKLTIVRTSMFDDPES